jgi:CubicO group peptidase (beta-lactamase class C family)
MKIVSETIQLFFMLIFLTTNNLSAEPIPDSVKIKIDKLFTEWSKGSSPGCAVGIVRSDSLIFSNGYGAANLEYAIPITPKTIFHMASVSKQFTAFSIVLLARQGKLKLEDDVRKYLPWFPDLKEKITVRNLLNHTSGIRDQWQLLATAGTRLDDVITQEHIIKILTQQKELNFKPGEQYSYCNSNFTMLAEIVKSITGQSLRKFTDSAIFKPLGMDNTHFHDDYTEIVQDRAYSYSKKDSAHFQNDILSYSNVGATSLFTNVDDMSKWVINFYDHKVGDQKDIDMLTQKGKLNSGKEINYALGISSDKHNGWKQFSHSGGDAGYRTFVSVFPDAKMGFIVFSNLGNFNPGDMANKMTDLFIKDTAKQMTADKEKKRDSAAAIIKNLSSLKNYPGDYISDEGVALAIEIKNSKLYYRVDDDSYLLMNDSKNTYSMFVAPDIKFDFSTNSKDTSIAITTPNELYRLKKYTKQIPSDQTLQEYTGIYYCPELDCKYGIAVKDHHLVLTNNKYNDTPLTLAGTDHLMNDFWWMNHLMVRRDQSKKIIGFEVNSGRVMHLKFDKIQYK